MVKNINFFNYRKINFLVKIFIQKNIGLFISNQTVTLVVQNIIFHFSFKNMDNFSVVSYMILQALKVVKVDINNF